MAKKIAEIEARTGQDIADIHEVLRWLGEENQARANETATLQPESKTWETRRSIGFKRED